jgi:hypothetical protein
MSHVVDPTFGTLAFVVVPGAMLARALLRAR